MGLSDRQGLTGFSGSGSLGFAVLVLRGLWVELKPSWFPELYFPKHNFNTLLVQFRVQGSGLALNPVPLCQDAHLLAEAKAINRSLHAGASGGGVHRRYFPCVVLLN